MASNFKFKLLTSVDPQAQYDAITTKDAMTFYLLNTGIGYLGTVKLFDATQNGGAITSLITDMLAEGFTPDDTSAASTKAIVDYVAEQIGNVSTVLTTAFFRKVESHTLTADDLANEAISIPDGVAEGDIGLLFTADTDNEDGGENYYFIPLTDYLQNVYDFESTKSIEMVAGENNKITFNLKIKAGEESIKVDEEHGGVYIEKATTVNEEQPSAAKLVTEDALVAFVNGAIQKALTDVVTAAIDDGSESQS